MKFREFSETSNKPIEKVDYESMYESMIEQADEINRLLDSIKIEESDISDIDQKWIHENESKEFNINYTSKPIEKVDYESMIEQADEINRLSDSIEIEESDISGIDQKWIHENESKEFNINYTIQQREEYLNAVKKLALQKLKGDLLFEGQLGATIRRFSSIGLNVSRESILKDIQEEVDRQYTSFEISTNDELKNTTVQSEIEQLKSNLGNIFGSTTIQEQNAQDETMSSGMHR